MDLTSAAGAGAVTLVTAIMMHPCRRFKHRGFTLLEVMVATAILAVGLTAVSGGLSLSVRSMALASGYERARRVAESEMHAFLATRPDRTMKKEGTTDGVRWRLVAESEPEHEGILTVMIEARFFAAGERSLVLETREVDRTIPQTTEVTQAASS